LTELPSRLAAALADRYRLERELGAGGMATVYLAQDLKHDRQVAIKVLRPELAAVIGAERFLSEIRTTANLQHPHILPLFDSGECDAFLFYVMPYVEGESLRDRLNREKQLPIADALRIATEVAGALDYAHKRGVIHRDIKPENVLLHDGRALVADFGIALAASKAGDRMTQTGMSLGTPHYMSPEQAMGEREITARSDVYALGAMTYEMLLGEPPFTGPTVQSIVAKVMTEPPAPLVTRRARISQAVEDAVLTALEKLPADRFASAAEFAAALDGDSAARPRATMAGRATPSRRHLGWPAVAAGTLLLGVAGGWLARRPPAPAPGPRVRVVLTPDSAAPPAAHACCAPAVAIAPDGRRFAYASRASGRPVVLVRDRDGFAAVPLADRLAIHPFFSPSGDSVGFADRSFYRAGVEVGASLARAAADGGAHSRVTPLPTTDLTGATWLPDGTIVFGQIGGARGLRRVRADGSGTVEELTTPDSAAGELRHVAPHYVPEVNGILFVTWMRSDDPAQASIALLTLADGKVKRLGRGLAPQYTSSGHLVSVTPDGVLFAERVDLRTGRRSGKAHRIAEGVSVRGSWTADVAVSRDGTLVFDQGRSEAALELVGMDGTARQLPIEAEGVAHWDSPRFSPDGRRVAASGSVGGIHSAFVLDLERHTAERITFEGQTEWMDWSGDGRSLVYVKSSVALAERAADRSGEERILWAGDDATIDRISVRGRWIAFTRTEAGATPGGGTSLASDIYALSRDSAAPRVWLATRFEERSPSLSPDGRWLAYVSNETGRTEVYVGAFPDASAGRQVVSTQGASEPQWSSDGRTLIYRTATGDFVAHDVSPGASFSVGPARHLFGSASDRSDDGADWDVLPGGDRFLVTTTRSVGSRLVWILNAIPEER
jgi:serine/threonine-protein kinase